MDVQSILSKLAPILPAAVILALLVAGLVYAIYALYRKKGGERKLNYQKFISAILLLGWFAVVLALTTFSRGANFERWFNFKLFSGYVSAWNQWSLSEWQLIIFNMLMFAPLGPLLPLLSKRTRRFGPAVCVSLLVTTGIETLQVVTRRGIFELDDIFHNTLGGIAGFLIMIAILDSLEIRKARAASIAKALTIPLLFTLLFSGAMIVYDAKELGNLSIRPAIPQNMEQVEVTLQTDLPDEEREVSLYHSSRIHNKEYGAEIARMMQRVFDVKQSGGMRIEGPNREWMFQEEQKNTYYLSYALADGGWTFGAENAPFPQPKPDDLLSYREPYENWMKKNDLLPAEAVFSKQNEDTLRWDLERKDEDLVTGQEDFSKGMIILVPSPTDQRPLDLFYSMDENKYIRNIDIISPAAAMDEIHKGNFSIYNDLQKGDRLQIEGYALTYVYDSKGYYQPVYKFEGTVNGESWETLIPAVKN